jgi:squalene-hopene/tetraprenyl-beta-curcumene cyclase
MRDSATAAVLHTQGTTRSRPSAALRRACDQLRALQHPGGWWKGEVRTNVTVDAEDLLLREFLGIREQPTTARAAIWIRSQQQDDGSWNTFWQGPGDLSTTIEAYLALRLAGDPVDADHMQAAAAFVRANGGIARARVLTQIWLALFGAWDWHLIPAVPPEIVLLPEWMPLNVYDFAYWTRQALVALSVVRAYSPCHRLPFELHELRGDEGLGPSRARSTQGPLRTLDWLLRFYERRPVRFMRNLALARAERWIRDRQEADGSWGGIQAPSMFSIIALALRGHGIEHPTIRRGLQGLDAFTIDDGTRRVEAYRPAVWDTALASTALIEGGASPDDPALIKAADWLLDRQIDGRGDWAKRRPELEGGGWAFEFENVNYPSVDVTAAVTTALCAIKHPDETRVAGAVERASRWVAGMQSGSGGWGAFDAENSRRLVEALPFCDFGEAIDPLSADVSAHAVAMLAAQHGGGAIAVQAGTRWLLANQEKDGSWLGRWGVNRIYGTGATVPALVKAGVDPHHPAIRTAVRWLEEHQNLDGGWGEDPRSYQDPNWIARGDSTPSQTAWALLALDAAGERSEVVQRGVDWLVNRQGDDGNWDEPQFTGTGFSGDLYVNDGLYRLVFPIIALARCTR